MIDDDPALLRALQVALGAAGHQVTVASTGQQGLARAVASAPDVVVLDLGLPDMDGLSVCRRLRAWSDVPVLVLSATGSEERKVAALDGGADDYVTKPFGMAELEARIRAAVRHRHSQPDEIGPAVMTVGRLSVDRVHHEVRLDGAAIELTAKEFDVLAFLATHQDKVCTHQMILVAVWGTTYLREAQYLHAYVHRLRRKLGDDSSLLIRTAPGIGYALARPDGDASPAPAPI